MIGSRIKALRKRKGYNMRQMASALNLPYTTYVNYEKDAREPNSEQLILISKYFGVSIDYLLGLVDESDGVDWSAEDLQVPTDVAEHLDFDPDKVRAFKRAEEQDAMQESFEEEISEDILRRFDGNTSAYKAWKARTELEGFNDHNGSTEIKPKLRSLARLENDEFTEEEDKQILDFIDFIKSKRGE